MKNCLSIVSAIALAATAAACTKSSPTRPTDAAASAQTAAVTDAKSGITLTTPQLVTPTDGQRFKFAEQPLTLTIKNAVGTGSSALTYSFQVATDSGFGSVVFSKDGVAEGTGQTALKIDKLAGNKDYFWRARASAGSQAGNFSSGRAFNVGPEVVLQTPVLANPSQNGTLNGAAALVVNNVGRTGPAGQVFYHFQISDSSSFDTILFDSTVAEQGGSTTSVQMTAKLNSNTTYYARVQASDPSNAVTTSFSSVAGFKYVAFDMRQAVIHDSPPDLGFWDETAHVTSVNFTVDAFLVDFDRRDGPNRWRDLDFGDGRGGSLQYTLGMCLNLSETWHCSAVVQFWYGRDLAASTPPSYVARNWFYDGRWGPMQGYQPQNGETVGLFVGTGNLRDKTFSGAGCPQICERSNVALVQWHNDDAALFTFSLAKTLFPNRR
jgi:hypothetical protein